MGKGLRRQHAAARRARDQPLLQKIRLDDFLDGVARLRQGRRHRLNSLPGPRHQFTGNRAQIAVIERIEPAPVKTSSWQARIREARVDGTGGLDGGKVAHARESRPATRGVPRARRAISCAPFGVSGS